jgi:hypothetical protein
MFASDVLSSSSPIFFKDKESVEYGTTPSLQVFGELGIQTFSKRMRFMPI